VIATNTAWDAMNAAPAKRPIYAMALSGQATVYTSADLAALGITGVLPDYRPWLKVPQGAAQSIDVVNGTSTIGELVCEVVDQGGALRTLIGTTVLEGATLTLSVGWPGIAWSEFVTVQTYQLYKVTPANGYTSWLFTSRDPQIIAKKTVSHHPENGALLSQDNPWYLGGTALEIVQAVLLFGLGLPAAAIDRDGMAALDSTAEGIYSAARPYLFAMADSFGAKQFLETEIYKSAGLYPVITESGKLSVRCFRPPAAGVAPVYAFTGDNTIGLPEIDRMPVINEAIVRFDYDGSAYQKEMYFLESDSLGTYGRTTQWVLESQGIRTELGGEWYAGWVADRIFRRFAGIALKGGAPTAKVEAFLGSAPVWAGDTVTLTHPKMPNLMTGDLGVAGRVYEVIAREPDYANGKMAYTLLDTGLTGTAAGGTWGSMVIGSGRWY
jgi:hypothetical protein